MTEQRTRYGSGLTRSVPAKLPLTTFHGWLKRLDPAAVNETGRLIMENVFPMFGESTPEGYLARNDRLAALNVELSEADRADSTRLRQLLDRGIHVKIRRHRRFSGGDGMLPRGCYSSICRDAVGNDDGTLSELLAYVDRRVPGIVYVGDPTCARLNAVFRNPIVVVPGFCAMYVLLVAPEETEKRVVYDEV